MNRFVSPQTDIELALFDFLSETFNIQCDDRQRQMGLSYVTEPTVEFVAQITNFAKERGYIVCETSDFLNLLHHNLDAHYVQRNDRGFVVMTAETGDLAKVASRLIARQLA